MAKFWHTLPALGRNLTDHRGYETDSNIAKFLDDHQDANDRQLWVLTAVVDALNTLNKSIKALPKQIAKEQALREAMIQRAKEALAEKARKDEIKAIANLPPPIVNVVQLPDHALDQLQSLGSVHRKF